jgi:hypothetical protein
LLVITTEKVGDRPDERRKFGLVHKRLGRGYELIAARQSGQTPNISHRPGGENQSDLKRIEGVGTLLPDGASWLYSNNSGISERRVPF